MATDFIRPFSEKLSIQLPPPSASASICEPFRETIELAVGRGRNAMAIWQDLVTDYGFSGAYNTVKRFVGKLRGTEQPEAAGIILTAPGEEAQVDYRTGPLVRDPQTGRYRRTRLFVMTLGYSRKAVRLLVFRSSTQTWAQLHETAFRRLGGSCRVLVLDNLKEGVLTPDIRLSERLRSTTLSCQSLEISTDGERCLRCPTRLSQLRRDRNCHFHCQFLIGGRKG